MSTADQPANAAQCECSVRGMTGGKFHPLCPVHGMPLIDLGRRHGVPADPEADERLRLDLAAIAEAERQALAPSSRRCDESCTVDCGRCKGQPLRDLRKRVIVALGFAQDSHGGVPFAEKDQWRQGFDAARRTVIEELNRGY